MNDKLSFFETIFEKKIFKPKGWEVVRGELTCENK
jgi:hypothetical protein